MFNRNKATESKIMPNMSCRIRHVEHIEYTSNNLFWLIFRVSSVAVSKEKILYAFSMVTQIFLTFPVPILDEKKELIYIFIFALLCMKDLKAPQKSVKIRI